MNKKYIDTSIFASYALLSLLLVIFVVSQLEINKVSSGAELEQSIVHHDIKKVKIGPVIEMADIFYDKEVFENALLQAEKVKAESNISAIVVPHHLLASDIIATMFKKVSGRDFERVVVIGPNHENLGSDAISTCLADWETPFGDVRHDKLIGKFLADFSQNSQIEIFKREHAIGGLMPFIKHYFPEVSVMPIIINSYSELNDINKLALWLEENVDQKTLVVYSIDFSHYLKVAEASQNDELTRGFIENRNIGEIMKLDNDFVDSPQVLALSLIMAEAKDYKTVIEINKNSFEYSIKKPIETTSYFGIGFVD